MIKVEMIGDRIIGAKIEARIAGHVGDHVVGHAVGPEDTRIKIGVQIALGTIMNDRKVRENTKHRIEAIGDPIVVDTIMRGRKVREKIKHRIGATVVGTITRIMRGRKAPETIKILGKMTDQTLVDLRVAVLTVVAALVDLVVLVAAEAPATTF